jgi:uncharacterized membrane protein YraQ (UPF0718 family)
MAWFTFSFPDFAVAFLSVLLEGVPFILLGTILSGLIDEFLPSKVMVRFLPKNAFLGVCVSGAMGLIFPMCECGIVPVIRRLMRKGLPISNAIAYMLAAPIVNPIVALSTFAAFSGQNAVEMTTLRLGVGYLVAILAAFAVHNLPVRSVLRDSVLTDQSGDHEHSHGGKFLQRIGNALKVTVNDFLDVMIYFILGVAISSLFSTGINREIFVPLATNVWLAVGSFMGLAVILSLCSTSDAFVAASFKMFPFVAKLAFLVLGPMFDLKMLFMYSAVFKKRFVVGLAVGLFVLIGLICVRLTVLKL